MKEFISIPPRVSPPFVSKKTKGCTLLCILGKITGYNFVIACNYLKFMNSITG